MLDQLNEALLKAENFIYERNFGVSASVALDDSFQLSWMRCGSKWGLFVEASVNPITSPVPLTQASASHRMLAAGQLQNLFAQLHVAVDKSTQDIQEALRAAERFLSDRGEQ